MWQHAIGQELPSYITYFVAVLTFLYLPNTFLQLPGLVFWLNLITHPLLCVITWKFGAPIQLVVSGNQLEHTGYHE